MQFKNMYKYKIYSSL